MKILKQFGKHLLLWKTFFHCLNCNDNFFCLQELRQTNPTAERHSHPSTELRCLLEAPKLAMVEAVHQGQASASGKVQWYGLLNVYLKWVWLFLFPRFAHSMSETFWWFCERFWALSIATATCSFAVSHQLKCESMWDQYERQHVTRLMTNWVIGWLGACR